MHGSRVGKLQGVEQMRITLGGTIVGGVHPFADDEHGDRGTARIWDPPGMPATPTTIEFSMIVRPSMPARRSSPMFHAVLNGR
jgi:hypothetical protein